MEVRKEVCMCEHCGNEAEMIITCTYEESKKRESRKCSVCGNEANMILEED